MKNFEELRYDCFIPKEIELENEKINALFIDKAYEVYLQNIE